MSQLNVPSHFGRILMILRQRQGLSHEDLRAGLPFIVAQDIEHLESMVAPRLTRFFLEKLADRLGVDHSEMIEIYLLCRDPELQPERGTTVAPATSDDGDFCNENSDQGENGNPADEHGDRRFGAGG